MCSASRRQCVARTIRLGVAAAAFASAANADHEIPAPTGLAALAVGADVWLTWDSYPTAQLPVNCTANRAVQIRRNGIEIATTEQLTDIAFSDPALGNGTYTYEIRARCRIPSVPGPGGNPAHNVFSPWSAEAAAIVSLASCAGPPTIVASASPLLLWPVNGRLLPVTVVGHVAPGPGCDAPATLAFSLVDEYDDYSELGAVAIDPSGTFSFTVHLEASRRGFDADGRLYTIELTASAEGYDGVAEPLAIVVPHDQRAR